MRKIFLFISLFLVVSALQAQKEITLEDIWKNGTFRTMGVPGFNFLADGKHYAALEENRIVKYDLTTGELVEVILDARSINDDYNIEAYEFAVDEKFIVLRSNTQRIYRRSYTAEYIIYDRSTAQTIPVDDMNQVSYATLDPTGKKVAFVKDNNLYYQHLPSGVVLAVTEDGEKNRIINGHTDWVYEEEFAFVKAFEWSTEGNHLAYIRFDETEVPEFTMTLHHNQSYPVYETFKYPKVGETNSSVSVHIHHIKNGTTTTADIGDLEDIYIPRIKWSANDDEVCIFKLNRHQNHLQIFRTDAQTGQSVIMLNETSEYYIDIHDNLTFINDGSEFIWTSENNGFNHIYLFDTSGRQQAQVTQGNWEVTNFYGYDPENKEVYYQSTEPGSTQRNIYSSTIDGRQKRHVAVDEGYNSAQFSSTFDYYVLNHSTISQPPTYNVYDRQGSVIRPLEDNTQLAARKAEYGVAPVELLSIEVEDGVKLNAAMIKPPDFDPEKKYPLFMFLYGGPGSQEVMNRWNSFGNYWWFQMLAQKGYIIAVVDNRGTGGKGEEFKKMTYLTLGKYETIDQINAARYLGNMDFIDADRIG
ncbi:MAG: DPP IV N-terminal domain-containing protein, partial [Saprospiraceae bacterium]|nr:DPP IV N-terminal domain-containing protein [Saprospiraceae bacterium]